MNTDRIKNIVIIFILAIVIPVLLGLLFGGASRIGSIEICFSVFGIPLLIAYWGLKNLKRVIILNIIISIPLIIISGIFSYEMRLSQLLFYPLLFFAFVMLIINFISIFKFWSNYNFKVFAPILISILTILLSYSSLKAGRWTNIYVFEKRLPQYQAAVRMVENRINEKSICLIGEEIPPEFRHLAISIQGEKDDSVLGVIFIWGVGFPCKHIAYAYISNGEFPARGAKFLNDWYYWERINDHWFIVGD